MKQHREPSLSVLSSRIWTCPRRPHLHLALVSACLVLSTKFGRYFLFDCMFLVVVNSVVPQPRIEDSVTSTDLQYVISGPGLISDVVPWALGCTRLSLGIHDGCPVSSVSLQPTTCRKRVYKA
jgi:hypothetical protein